ncbi:MAG: hypothetical protein AAGF73_10420 [Actinomycetota bacterium]
MRRPLVPLALTALVIASCGGDDGSDDAATTVASTASDTEEAATDEASSAPTTVTDADGDASDIESAADTDSDDDSAADDSDGSDDSGGSDDDGGGIGGIGEGTATLTLANGETFDFSTLCVLESQEVAGSVIEWNIVSQGDPALDVTQFGDEGTVTGFASIGVFDGSTFETIWEASTLNESLGGTFELVRDGSTVTGGGSFYPQGDVGLEPVEGEFVANC